MVEQEQKIIHLEKILKDEYNYTFHGDLEDFYKQPFIELEGDGVNALCWITYRKKRYLFKAIPEFSSNVWGELLSEEFAKFLGIPCAEYHVAFFNQQYGLITKSFLRDDEALMLGSEIIQEFFNSYHLNKQSFPLSEQKDLLKNLKLPEEVRKMEAFQQEKYIFGHLNNLEQISTILGKKSDLSLSTANQIKQSLSQMLLFDIITLQADRHSNNWAIIKTKDGYRPSPLFDNATSFGLGFPFMGRRMVDFREEHFNSLLLKDPERINKTICKVSPNFTLSRETIKKTDEKEKGVEVLKSMLEKTDEDGQRKIANLLEVMDLTFLDSVIKTVEEKNGISMSSEVYYYISNVFNHNMNQFREVAHNKERKNTNERTRRTS